MLRWCNSSTITDYFPALLLIVCSQSTAGNDVIRVTVTVVRRFSHALAFSQLESSVLTNFVEAGCDYRSLLHTRTYLLSHC